MAVMSIKNKSAVYYSLHLVFSHPVSSVADNYLEHYHHIHCNVETMKRFCRRFPLCTEDFALQSFINPRLLLAERFAYRGTIIVVVLTIITIVIVVIVVIAIITIIINTSAF